MKWIILAIAIAAACWWWFYESKKPYFHRKLKRERFEWLLRTLAMSMKEKSILFIEHEASARFLQFVKVSHASGPRIGFAFPDAPWSRECFERLAEQLSIEGYEVSRIQTSVEDVRRFIEIEFRGPIDEQIRQAVSVAGLACRAMGLSEGETYAAHFRGDLDAESIVGGGLMRVRELRRQRRRERNGR